MVLRLLPLRKNQECSGCTEFGTLKLFKLTYGIHIVDLSIHNLKPHGIGYIIVTKNTARHINTAC
jgi:hypothetical protein